MELLVYNIILCGGFLVSFVVPHMPGRQMMLWGNVMACILFSTYFYGVGEVSAMLALMIAGTSSLMQSLIPKERLDETLAVRLLIAVVMAGVSIKISYHDAMDLLPLMAVIMMRFSETFKDPQMLRVGNVLPLMLWTYFNYDAGLYLPMWGDALMLISYFWAILRVEQMRRRVPVAVAAE